MSSEDQLYLIEQLANEFFARNENGDSISVSDFVVQHPAQADELRDFIEGLQLVRDLKLKTPQARPKTKNPPALVAPGKFPSIPDYRIIRELGRGAMGVVYEAEQLSLNRRVALKTMLQTGEARGRLRFQHEARTAARLHHPGIVPVYDVGEADGLMYYAMQYVEGRGLDSVAQAVRDVLFSKATPGSSVEAALASWLMSGSQTISGTDFKARRSAESSVTVIDDLGPTATPSGSAPTPNPTADQSESSNVFSRAKPTSTKLRQYHKSIARIGWHVADALAFAHEHGVIHRDIKPANLLLDSSGEVWVADFGLVKTHDTSHTQTGAFVGTLRYMAPERFQGECDVRSDVYSLGMTLYELLALRPALDSTDQMSLLNQIRDTEPQPLRTLEHRIPRDLEVIVMRAIQKEPHRRYSNARMLADDLDNYLNGRPIQARHVSTIEKIVIWARRKPVVAGLLTLLMCVLISTILGSVYAAFAFRDVAKEATNAKIETEETLALSNYYLAWARWDDDRAGEAIDYLDRIPVKHRHMEWALAKRHFRGGYMEVALGHDIKCTRFSPDGSKVFSLEGTNRILITDSTTGNTKTSITLDDGSYYVLAAHPDSSQVAVGSKNGRVAIWNTQSGQQMCRDRDGKSDITSLCFSPCGNYLAIGHRDGRVRLVDIKGKSIWSQHSHSADVNGIAFHPNGKHLISVGADGVCAWRTMDGHQLAEFFQQKLQSVSYSPDGRRVALGSRGGDIFLYSVSNRVGNVAGNPPTTPQSQTDLDVEADDASPAKLVFSQLSVMRGHSSSVSRIAFCQDGMRLVSMSPDTTLRTWEAESGALLEKRTGLHGVSSGDVAPDGYRIVSSGLGSLVFWDSRTTGSQLQYWGHQSKVGQIDFSSDSRYLLSNSDENIRLLDAHTLTPIKDFTWNEARTNQALFSHDDRRVFACSDEGKVQVWDLETGATLGSYVRGNDNITSMSMSSDGRLLAIADEEEAALLDIVSLTALDEERVGTRKRRRLPPHPAKVQSLTGFSKDANCIAFSPDDSTVVCGDRGGDLIRWDRDTGNEIHRMDHGSRVGAVVFTRDGQFVSVGGYVGRIWSDNGELLRELVGHRDNIRCAAVSPDCSRIVTGDSESIRVWDLATGDQLCEIAVTGASALKFSPDGKQLGAGLKSGVSVWNLSLSNTDEYIRDPESVRKAYPEWHDKQAERSRELQNWYATLIHRARQLAIEPDSVEVQLQIFAAMRMLWLTAPEAVEFVPEWVQENEWARLALDGGSLSVDEKMAESINVYVFPLALESTVLGVFDAELELIKTAELAFPRRKYKRTLALSHYRRGEFQQAIAVLTGIDSKGSFDFHLLAMSHLQLKNKQEAQEFELLARSVEESMELHLAAETKRIRKESNDLFEKNGDDR